MRYTFRPCTSYGSNRGCGRSLAGRPISVSLGLLATEIGHGLRFRGGWPFLGCGRLCLLCPVTILSGRAGRRAGPLGLSSLWGCPG